MKKRAWLSIFLVLVLGISFVAPVALAEDTIKIGGIASLSGGAAAYGQAIQKGVNLYIKQLNAQGGIDGKKIEVFWEDDRGEPTDGVNAFNKLVDNDGVVAIIGAVISRVTLSIVPYANDIGIPMITASSTAEAVTLGNPSVFRTCFIDNFQAVIMARYAKDEGYSKVAIMYDNGEDYSKGLYDNFIAEAAVLGLDIVATESAAFSDVDFKTQLTNIKNSNPNAVFLPYYGEQAALILNQAKQIGLDVKFLGADGLSNVVETITDKTLLTNMTYSDHFSIQSDSQLAKEFVEAYKAEYNEEPNISFSATGYDAALVLAEALKKGSTKYEDVVAAVRATNIDAVSGKISFDEINNPIKSAFITTFDEQGNKVFVKVQNP